MTEWYDFAPWRMDFRRFWVNWGNGGVSFNYDVSRTDHPGAIASAKARRNPYLRWFSYARVYPYAHDKNANKVARPFPESWGFRFHFERSTHLYDPPNSGPMQWFITVPHWFLFLLLAITPALWLRRAWKRRHRYKKGFCAKCGYDLRATPDRCPECGTVPPGAKEAAAGAPGGDAPAA